MKRVASSILILGWLGCSTQSVPPPAQIQGTNGLALFGSLLFITSTETNEIKVLNVGAVTRDFVRAPNPLEPLSIPVLDRPIDLARDLNYDNSGAEVVGPYLYARGQSSSEISIVGTDLNTQLVELKRVLTSGIVTAIAARGPNPPGASAASTLYFATADTPRCQVNPDGGQCPPGSVTRATLWQATVPLVDSNSRLSASVTPIPRAEFNSTVTSIVIMPSSPNLAIATRTLSGVNGRTVIFNPDTSTVVNELPFPSSVRYLATNPTVNALLGDGGTTTLDAGSRLYGILDETSCSSALPCPAIVAVDTAARIPDGGIPDGGLLSADSTGMPMAPLTYGPALPMAITFARNAMLPLPNPTPLDGRGTYLRDRSYLIGFVPTSNGATYFFDAVGLLPINGSLVVDGGSLGVPQYFGSDGGVIGYVEGPIASTLATTNGKARDENILVVYQGTIPGFQNLTGPDAGAATFAAASSPFDNRVRQGDLVVLSGSGCGDYSATDAGLVISALNQDAGVLFTAGGVPVSCTQSTFSVRAAGTAPYVVNGTLTGYMDRTGPNQPFAFDGGFLYRPCPRNLLSGCTLPGDGPQLSFTFGNGDPAIQRDFFYSIPSVSGFASEFVQIDTSGAFFGVEFRFPTNAVNVADLPDGGLLDRFFVSYPSANAVIEFDPANVTPNSNALSGVYRYN
jgi:hypothetical protein